MHLTELRLRQFRNHSDSWFDFGDGTNILLGDNGQGKTNVIEAISYLCLTRSFFATNDALAVQFENPLFEIEGTFVADSTVKYSVRVAYDIRQEEKLCTINRHPVEPFSTIIGKFPVVICAPEHAPITSEGPFERRKFVDFVLSQSYPAYFQHLLEFRKILKQRNKILLDGKLSKTDCSKLLIPWNEQLVTHGSFLMMRRKQFVDEFQTCIQSAYQQIAGEEEQPHLEYVPQCSLDQIDDEQNVRTALMADLDKKHDSELRYGITLVGPHRDEFGMKINGLDIRKFASQGQHKTFLVALKIGEFFYLKDRCNETPIMLLDDIFSELDGSRSSRLLQFVETLSQTFITSTNRQIFEENAEFGGRNKLFTIQNGTVVQQSSLAV